MRLPPASCHRLRNHSPEHNFPHLRAAGSESVATAVCRHAGSTLLSARGGGKHAWERAEQGPGRAAAGTRGRVSMTAPSAEPRPGRAPRRPLIGRPRFVALLLRRCPPLIGGALAAGVRAQVSLPAPGGQGPLPEALAQHEAPRRGRVGGRAALSHVPAASRRRSRPLRGLGAAEGSALGAEPAGAAHAACESGGAGGAPRAPVQAGRLLLQPALIDSSALVYRGVAGLLSWQEGGGAGRRAAQPPPKAALPPLSGPIKRKLIIRIY